MENGCLYYFRGLIINVVIVLLCTALFGNMICSDLGIDWNVGTYVLTLVILVVISIFSFWLVAKIMDRVSLYNEKKLDSVSLRIIFWNEFIAYNKKYEGIYASSYVGDRNLVSRYIKSIKGGYIIVSVTSDKCRVDMSISTGNQSDNKQIFDKLVAFKDEIDEQLPGLDWQRMDEKVVSRIRVEQPFSYLIPEKRDEMIRFLTNTSKDMMSIFQDLGYRLNLQ